MQRNGSKFGEHPHHSAVLLAGQLSLEKENFSLHWKRKGIFLVNNLVLISTNCTDLHLCKKKIKQRTETTRCSSLPATINGLNFFFCFLFNIEFKEKKRGGGVWKVKSEKGNMLNFPPGSLSSCTTNWVVWNKTLLASWFLFV